MRLVPRLSANIPKYPKDRSSASDSPNITTISFIFLSLLRLNLNFKRVGINSFQKRCKGEILMALVSELKNLSNKRYHCCKKIIDVVYPGRSSKILLLLVKPSNEQAKENGKRDLDSCCGQ